MGRIISINEIKDKIIIIYCYYIISFIFHFLFYTKYIKILSTKSADKIYLYVYIILYIQWLGSILFLSSE